MYWVIIMFFLVLFCQDDGKRFELVKAQPNGGKFPVKSTASVVRYHALPVEIQESCRLKAFLCNDFYLVRRCYLAPRAQDWKRARDMLRTRARESELSSLLSCMTLANQCQKLFPCQLTDQDVPVNPTANVIYIYSYLAEEAMKWCLTVYSPPSWTVPRRGRKLMRKKSSITSQIQLKIRGKQGWCISQDHWLSSS